MRHEVKYFWEITLKDKSKYQFKSLILTCSFPQLKKLAKKYLDKKILKLNGNDEKWKKT